MAPRDRGCAVCGSEAFGSFWCSTFHRADAGFALGREAGDRIRTDPLLQGRAGLAGDYDVTLADLRPSEADDRRLIAHPG